MFQEKTTVANQEVVVRLQGTTIFLCGDLSNPHAELTEWRNIHTAPWPVVGGSTTTTPVPSGVLMYSCNEQ